jgi:hypothetical protein
MGLSGPLPPQSEMAGVFLFVQYVDGPAAG